MSYFYFQITEKGYTREVIALNSFHSCLAGSCSDGSCTFPSDSSTQLDAFIRQSYPHFPAQSPIPSPSYLQTGLQSSRDPSSSVFCSFVFLGPSLSLSPSVSQVQPPPQKLRSGLSYFWRPCSLLLLSDLLPNSSQMGPS